MHLVYNGGEFMKKAFRSKAYKTDKDFCNKASLNNILEAVLSNAE